MKVGVEKKFDETDYTLRLLALFLNIIFWVTIMNYYKNFSRSFLIGNEWNKWMGLKFYVEGWLRSKSESIKYCIFVKFFYL